MAPCETSKRIIPQAEFATIQCVISSLQTPEPIEPNRSKVISPHPHVHGHGAGVRGALPTVRGDEENDNDVNYRTERRRNAYVPSHLFSPQETEDLDIDHELMLHLTGKTAPHYIWVRDVA